MKFFLRLSKAVMLFCLLLGTSVFSQVGIGTVTPDTSSVLDVFSTTQGMLTPRMTTEQKNAIVSPADGLMVYDTDLKSFYHYNSAISSWIKMSSETNGRLKYKLIKSTDVLATVLAAEKLAGGSKYLLDTNTYYEINGTINFDFPIDLNNAYVSGQDANEDKLVRTTGNLFDGATGGSIRNVTLQVSGGGKVFNLSGTAAQNILIRDLVIAGSSNVGSITNFGLVFVSIVQYVGNSNGIVYDSISQLLISNAAWFSSNGGTYEKIQGTFDLIQKQGGFSEVSGTAFGFDVSSNPTINRDAVMESVVFTGTNTTSYVKGYTVGSYPGYNFNNSWNVRCAGIPTEVDAAATGDINLSAAVGTGVTTSFSGTGSTSRKKISGTTTSSNLFRFAKEGDNKIVYKGSKPRYFQITASLSYQGSSADMTLILYFAKNGVVLTDTKVYGSPSTGFFSSAGILALPIVGTVQLKKDDYIEIWGERYDGTGNISTVSLNLITR